MKIGAVPTEQKEGKERQHLELSKLFNRIRYLIYAQKNRLFLMFFMMPVLANSRKIGDG